MTQPRTKRVFDLRKAVFILPNAFTLASIFCGVYSVLNLFSGQGPEILYQSAIAIFFAGFFDMFDGRVARLTRTQSEFGTQMDSLADAMSFGLAPAVLVYKWALWPLGLGGIFVAFAYAACGAIRLARFNVLASRHQGSKDYFVGLPIPFAAGMLIASVMAHYQLFGGELIERNILVVVLVVSVSILMVSNVPYWSFKRVRMDAKVLAITAVVLAGVWIISQLWSFAVALVLIAATYILAGIIWYLAKFVLPQQK